MVATSTAELLLPDELGGPWEHALFLSYGLDIPFFERALARQLAPSCRNRILLGDERTYLASCDAYADGDFVRSANIAYVAEPILRRTSSHAKVILLTSANAGRLLVGSGNISRQGFASGGELFTGYAYDESEPGALQEFISVRTLLERLRDDDLLTRTSAWHVDRMLEGTPWLYSVAAIESRVRHNLDRSLADQLVDDLDGEPVKELVVLAPFFDPELAALSYLIDRLGPERTTVLVQRAQTSIDPDALDRLRRECGGAVEVRPFERPPHRPWVHAKLVLARTRDAAVCLQGSANVSAAALLRTGIEANLEVVNLLRGNRGAFDGVVDELDIGGPAGDLAGLELQYQVPKAADRLIDEGWQLTAAEWSDGVLDIRFRGQLPPLHGSLIESGGMTFAMEIVGTTPDSLSLSLTTPEGTQVQGVTPIRIVLADGRSSNAIFPADHSALVRALELGSDTGEKLALVGDLGLDDDELEQLLQELDATLVVDQRSLWQLSGRPAPPEDEAAGEEPHIDYADIDYEMLRSHPKMQQYVVGAGSLAGRGSRLQIVLNAITSAFADIAAVETAIAIGGQAVTGDGVPVDGGAEEEDEEERPRRRWALEARVNMLFRNFVKRFLRGLASREFQDVTGPEVVVRNYVVFFHLLSVLADREWIDQRFVTQGIRRTIELFWGATDTAGYAGRLDERERLEVLEVVRATHSDAQLIATLYSASRDTRPADLQDLRVALRDAWRGLLVQGDLPLTTAALADARVMLRGVAPPDGPPLTDILEELYDLAEFRTRDELLAGLAERLGVPETACMFVDETVSSPSLGPISVETLRVEDDDARPSVADTRWALQTWLTVEPQRHYRLAITSRDGRRTRYVAFYETAIRRGLFASLADKSTVVPLTSLAVPAAPWDDAMTALMEAADGTLSAATVP
jgi:hypothetical protein